MKYIIDLPDEIAEASVRYWKEATDMTLVPYTESDRKVIEDEVWEFVTTCTKINGADSVDVFGGFSPDSFTKFSYQEAKAKYDAWKKEKEEIHVGDEVTYGDTSGVVVGIDTEDIGIYAVWRDGRTGYMGMRYVTKTGRHFVEIEKLLEKMGKQE